MLNFTTLYFLMLSPAKNLESRKFVGTLIRCLAATIPLALACHAVLSSGPAFFTGTGVASRMALVLAAIIAGSAAYFLSCLLLRVDETSAAMGIIRRKILK
jgi:hypothetical protein